MLFLPHAFLLSYYCYGQLLASLPGARALGLGQHAAPKRGHGKLTPKKFMTAEDAPVMKELEDAYGGELSFWSPKPGLCGKCISTKDQESILSANHETNWSAGIYGEIQPDRIVHMLRELGARPGQRYYDLGSGAGKTVVLAARFLGMNATGIELSKDRHVVGCQALDKLQHARSQAEGVRGTKGAGSVELVHGSFFDFDFSDADIIFLDSVEWTSDMMERLGQLFKGLKRGSKIVSLRRPGAELEQVGTLDTAGNWGEMKSRVFLKTSKTRQIQSLPRLSQAATRCSVAAV